MAVFVGEIGPLYAKLRSRHTGRDGATREIAALRTNKQGDTVPADGNVRSQPRDRRSIHPPSHLWLELRVRKTSAHIVFTGLSGFEERDSIDHEIKRMPLSLLRIAATNPMKACEL